MRKLMVNAEDWKTGETELVLLGNGIKSRKLVHPLVGTIEVAFKSNGPRSKSNKPAWHVYRDGQDVGDVCDIQFGDGAFYASGMGIVRSCRVSDNINIPEAAAVAAFKLFCNL